jgi:NAD(P)-dependent dehydrogenase (short-subunit alcohol dehydrogenase family)
MGRFDGKTALITGSTQGVGEAVARRLAAEGARGIVVCGRNRERGEAVAADLAAQGATARFVQVELADADSCRRLIAETDAALGRIDILVNSAGLTLRGTIVDTTVELWDDMMNINVRAPFLLMQGAIEIMRREGRGGAIVNVGSISSHGSIPRLMPYAVSKAGLAVLTKNVAYSVAWDRIRVNCINAGWMDTPGEAVIQKQVEGSDDNWLERAEAAMPFGKIIKLDEIAALIAFVASGEAGVMTGSVIDYDQSVIGAGYQPIPKRDMTP